MNTAATITAAIIIPIRKPLPFSRLVWLAIFIGLIFDQKSFGEDEPLRSPSDLETAVVSLPPAVEPAPELVDEEADGIQDTLEYLEGVPRPVSPPTPAAKMTVRLQPIGERLIAAQEKLAPRDPLTSMSTRPDVLPWIIAPAYGKYICIPHEPLLFEDIPAERYGESCNPCLQPVVSFTKFVGTVPMLPYKISMDYCAAKYENAYYAYDHHGNWRPGVVEGAYFPDYYLGAPYPDTRFKAMAVQLGMTAGIILLLPF